MVIQVNLTLTDADWAAYQAATPTDQQTFLIAKLAAQFAPKLQASLTAGNVMAMLSQSDQQAIGGLITAIKAVQ
jgi:hypothetical protein